MKNLLLQMLQMLENSFAQSEQMQIQIEAVKQNQILKMNFTVYRY